MRRHHLIELHEQPWMPRLWRTMFQEGLGRALTIAGAYKDLAAPFSRFLQRTGAHSILDLCSGSAEPIVMLREALGPPLDTSRKPTIVLSDLYPPLDEFERVRRRYPQVVDYHREPVNALHPPEDSPGVRTMISALHHFKPEQVKAILANAAQSAEGIAVFEATGRTYLNLLYALGLPFIAALIYAFLLRPFRVWYVVWGLLLPVVPLIAFVDGVVSILRTYTVEELEEFTRAIDAPGFEWEIGQVPLPGTSLKATYLFGWRSTTPAEAGHEPVSEIAGDRDDSTAGDL